MSGPEPIDDPTISDDEILLRRVAPEQMANEGGELRVSSNAFHDITDQQTGARAVSVFVESRVLSLGVSLPQVLEDLEGFGLVAITVREIRDLGLGVTWAPNDLSLGAAHAHLNGNKNRPVRRRLALASRQVIWPGGSS